MKLHSKHDAMKFLDWTEPEKGAFCKMKRANECDVTTRYLYFGRYRTKFADKMMAPWWESLAAQHHEIGIMWWFESGCRLVFFQVFNVCQREKFEMILTCIQQHASGFLKWLCCCALLDIWRSSQNARSGDEKKGKRIFKQKVTIFPSYAIVRNPYRGRCVQAAVCIVMSWQGTGQKNWSKWFYDSF